ncbi:hypothetical protein DH2020_019931 [Rehmannia glutinosa]|uniref:Reverse transcriptase n=1 Tax=Rehmannia glutinosa TaxID=99300 RepID=A0ABR0WF79_REHGL
MSKPTRDVEGLMVNGLIQQDEQIWNKELIDDLFNQEEAAAIRTIPISSYRREDRLIWHYSKDGQYRVKSGYKVAKSLQENIEAVPSTSIQISGIWKWLWALNVPPKVNFYVEILPWHHPNEGGVEKERCRFKSIMLSMWHGIRDNLTCLERLHVDGILLGYLPAKTEPTTEVEQRIIGGLDPGLYDQGR